MNLADRHRPSTWADVVGQDKIVQRLQGIASRGSLAGRAYWLSGQSGTGKTTIARLIAAEIADPFMVRELDAAIREFIEQAPPETKAWFLSLPAEHQIDYLNDPDKHQKIFGRKP